MAQHQLATLQVATFGSEGQHGIASGIRSFPVHKLVIICFASDKNKEFARKIRNVLGLPVTINVVTKENVIRETMERVNEILNLNAKEFQQVLMNVSCGDKLLGCAALSAGR
jgi:PII-like signaling protein